MAVTEDRIDSNPKPRRKRRLLILFVGVMVAAGVARWCFSPRPLDAQEFSRLGWQVIVESRATELGAFLWNRSSRLSQWLPDGLLVKTGASTIVIDLDGQAEPDGLVRLRDCSMTKQLIIRGADMTDLELSNLLEMESLEALHLDGTSVTADGLSRLCEEERLVRLVLSGDQFDDEQLRRFRPGSSLMWLELYDTSVSLAAARKFDDRRQLDDRYDGVDVFVYDHPPPPDALKSVPTAPSANESPAEGT